MLHVRGRPNARAPTTATRLTQQACLAFITLISSQFLVDKSVIINGAGADVLALDGNVTSRVFQTVTGAKTVSISGMTIRNGQGNEGGGIFNADTATLTIICSALSGNTAGLGGGVFNSGMLIIVNSTFSSNMASEAAESTTPVAAY